MTFETKEELILQARKDKACQAGINWAMEKDYNNNEKTLEYIIAAIPYRYRIWCISRGYMQFFNLDFIDDISPVDKKMILIRQPQLSVYF